MNTTEYLEKAVEHFKRLAASRLRRIEDLERQLKETEDDLHGLMRARLKGKE